MVNIWCHIYGGICDREMCGEIFDGEVHGKCIS
jgi:hypothetical protein